MYIYKITNKINNKIYIGQTYNKTIYNDSIKNKFCQLNNIQLIRISYEDINNKNYKNIIQTITT